MVIIKSPRPNFREQNVAECAWLEAYNGTSKFYLSLKSQLESKHFLSPAQLGKVTEALARESHQQQFSLIPGQVIHVSKWAAHKIAQEAGLTRPHYSLKVIRVISETERAIRAEVRLTASRTSYCCVCGLKLTNPESILTGIGPICSERSGVSFGGASLKELEEKLLTTKNVMTWIPKQSIQDLREEQQVVAA